MPADSIIWITATLAMFGMFLSGVGYGSLVADGRALTLEQEQATHRAKTRAAPAYSEPLKQAA